MKASWDTNSIETSVKVISAVQDFQKTLMANWSLIENQPLLKENTSDYNYPTGKYLRKKAFKMKKYNLKAADNTTEPQKSTLGIRAGLSLTSF